MDEVFKVNNSHNEFYISIDCGKKSNEQNISHLPDLPIKSIFFTFLAAKMPTVSLPVVGWNTSETQTSPKLP
jgi:hypothetical protein